MQKLLYELLRRSLRLKHRISRVAVQSELPVEMSDGTVLLADRWYPADGEAKPPMLLVRSPYGRSNFGALFYSKFFAHQGFQVVIQSCRGTGGSEGTFSEPFGAEIADGRDTVSWLRSQDFYPGNFATVGASYFGYTQLALPPESKVDLVAAVLQATPTSTRELVWPNGCFALETSLSWATQVNRGPSALLANMLNMRQDAKAVRNAGLTTPLTKSYRQATGNHVSFFERWCDDPRNGSAWWFEEDQSGSLDTFECPVLIQAGWYDLFLEQSFVQFNRLSKRRSDARLTVGPWTHTGVLLKGGNLVMNEAVDFLWSAFGRASVKERSPICLLDSVTSAEHLLESWPSPSQAKRLYLRPGQLGETPTNDQGRSSFVYNPAFPTPALGGRLLSARVGTADNSQLEARSDVLTLKCDKFQCDVTLVGAPLLQLWVSSDRPAPDLFVRLNRVDSRGRSTNLTDKMIRARLAEDSREPSLIEVELPPICATLKKGEGLRLVVSGGAFPQFARSSGFDRRLTAEVIFEPYEISLHYGPGHQSCVDIPLMKR